MGVHNTTLANSAAMGAMARSVTEGINGEMGHGLGQLWFAKSDASIQL